MPGPDHRVSTEHYCSEVIDLVYSSRLDLKDAPIKKADDNWFTNGSCFMEKGVRKAGYVIVSLTLTV